VSATDHDDHGHDHGDDHGDDHGHDHGAGGEADEHEGIDRTELSPYAYRVLAMRDLLVERGVVTEEAIASSMAALERFTPVNGARLVARAWIDDGFRARLLEDAHAASAELGIRIPDDPHVTVLENSADVHHLVVCTLCSCYPRSLLGRPPDWYKSLNYRSRAVSEPRSVLAEFGLELSDDVAVRVVDSTADHRYLVLPDRPEGTESMSEDELVAIISRDAMIGAGAVEVH
jgi:nitrile hydratase